MNRPIEDLIKAAGMKNVNQVLTERGKTHGCWAQQAGVAQELKAVIRSGDRGQLSKSQREALEMIAHKISRILCGDPDHKDHWVDIAGYATLAAKELPE